uniref:Maturation protein n=1 Tax=Hubei levi-like virus 7 TaxID=1922919 RepID=A0A1L3KIS6_9VIRU|nr:hypothetical protein [Hubei levi-like virus 7]
MAVPCGKYQVGFIPLGGFRCAVDRSRCCHRRVSWGTVSPRNAGKLVFREEVMARKTFKEVQKGDFEQIVYNREVSNGPVVATRTSARTTNYYLSGYRDSVNTPDFHSPRRGLLKPQAFEYYHEEARITRRFQRTVKASPAYVGNLGQTSTGNSTTSESGLTGAERLDRAYTTILPAGMDAECRNKILAKLKSSKVNLAVAGAERVKTADMIAKTAINFANAYRNLRKGNFAKAAEDLGVPPAKRAKSRFNKDYAKRGARAAGGGWLALQYGWKPLISDIYGSCEAIARAGNQPVIGRVKQTVTRTFPLRRRTVSKSQDLVQVDFWDGEQKVAVQYGITFVRENGGLHVLSELGITNPALIAWELVPFSFVVDWFLPIGSWLETFDATSGLVFHSGYRTTFSTMTSKYVQTRNGTYSNYTDDTYWAADCEDIFTKRVVLTSFPIPGLPSFKNPVSIGHAANALALLTQLFKR